MTDKIESILETGGTGEGTFTVSTPLNIPMLPSNLQSSMDCKLQFYGPLRGHSSFSNVADTIATTIANNIDDSSFMNYHASLGESLENPILAKKENNVSSAPVGVFFGLPNHAPENFLFHRIRIAIMVCEGDRIPHSWVAFCNQIDLVIVPSDYCKQVFLECGVETAIMIVPHGVHPVHVPLKNITSKEKFVFYNTFRGNYAHERKSFEETIECFQLAFAGRTDVELRLRVGNSMLMPKSGIKSEMSEQIIFDSNDKMTLEETVAAYHAADCVVHPSKSEGFGLVPLEALCCGIPVIAPAVTGLADYLDEEYALLLNMGPKKRIPGHPNERGNYYSVDKKHLVERMLFIVDNIDKERAKLLGHVDQLVRKYSWDSVLTEFNGVLDSAIHCENRTSFLAIVGKFKDRKAISHYRELSTHRAIHGFQTKRQNLEKTDMSLPFSSIIYCGWDRPRDGIGNHLRLLDQYIFNIAEIKYRSLDELPSNYGGEFYQDLTPGIHEQRPDLFTDAIYLDVVGFQGREHTIYRQIDRVKKIKEKTGAFCMLYLMWETDQLWAPMLDLVKIYDRVIVTSFLLDVYFKENDVQYTKLPHPYEYKVNLPARIKKPTEPLTLGMTAGLWPRKNMLLLAESFSKVLGNNGQVQLKLHTRTKPFDDNSWDISSQLELLCARFTNIDFVIEEFSEDDYASWMNSLDVYCFVSAGEGYSVTPREALHMKKPVILLDAHVHREFSHLPGIIPIHSNGKIEAKGGFSFLDAGVGREYSVDIDNLEKTLSTIVNTYPSHVTELKENFEQIVSFHNLNMIRKEWLSSLSNVLTLKNT